MRPVVTARHGALPKVQVMAFAAFALAGCASYQPRSLPGEADLAPAPTALRVGAETFPLPQLKGHVFDMSDGLDWVEIAMLAVANNPGLKAGRAQRGEAAAQVYAAGLLPDPRLSITLDHPDDGGPDRVNGFDLALGIDPRGLVTRGAALAARRSGQRQIELDLLWQEWQVIQQARLLVVRVAGAARRVALLEEAQARYEDRLRRARQLMRAGRLTLGAAGAMTSAWFDVSRRLNQERRAHSRDEHALHALLGLAPGVPLPLVPPAPPGGAGPAVDEQLLAELPRRRPDLRALQAAYQSQEQRLRQAVLAQFPALHVGISRARDIDGVATTGFGVTLDLPLFAGNRGRIALERATRERLRAEYQARLDQDVSDISRLLDEQKILAPRRARLQRRLPELESLVAAARRAYQRGDLPALDLLNLERTLLDVRLEVIDLDRALWEVRIALDTLLAWPETEG